MLTFKDVKQFQAITMLARSIFETAVEIRLMRANADAEAKVSLFEQLEKLKAARKIVRYKTLQPNAKVAIASYE